MKAQKEEVTVNDVLKEASQHVLIDAYVQVLGSEDALKALMEMFPREHITAQRLVERRQKQLWRALR